MVSIIIVNFNTKDLTLACLTSIYKFSPKEEFEVIVIDNGSSDGSLEKLRENRNITLIEADKNLGFAKGNNLGIKKAKGEYVLLLNSDTEVKKDSIQNLIDFAKRTPDAGAVASRLLNIDGSFQASIFRFPTVERAIKQYWLGRKHILDKYVPEGESPSEVEVAVMASFLITPKTLKEVGGLNEKYFMFFEDFDYCRQIKRKGMKIYYLPSSEVVHHHGASGRKLADSENQWRRLIPSSKIYHGLLGHYLFNFVLWTRQKVLQLFG